MAEVRAFLKQVHNSGMSQRPNDGYYLEDHHEAIDLCMIQSYHTAKVASSNIIVHFQENVGTIRLTCCLFVVVIRAATAHRRHGDCLGSVLLRIFEGGRRSLVLARWNHEFVTLIIQWQQRLLIRARNFKFDQGLTQLLFPCHQGIT